MARGNRQGGRRKHQTAWLPLDVIAAMAVRSDVATLVRCAATCRDARRRIADDPNFRGRLRLRQSDRFVFPLLRGHLVDTTADATRLTKATFGPRKTSRGLVPMHGLSPRSSPRRHARHRVAS
jgi:hypothetical protein